MQANNLSLRYRPRGRPKTGRPLRKLRQQLRAANLTLTAVSEAAQVSLPTVSNVFSGHAKSRRIVEVAKQLIAERNGGERA